MREGNSVSVSLSCALISLCFTKFSHDYSYQQCSATSNNSAKNWQTLDNPFKFSKCFTENGGAEECGYIARLTMTVTQPEWTALDNSRQPMTSGHSGHNTHPAIMDSAFVCMQWWRSWWSLPFLSNMMPATFQENPMLWPVQYFCLSSDDVAGPLL